MCTAFWAVSPSDSSPYLLVLAANRDLNLQRPASDAEWHAFEPIGEPKSEKPWALSGRDLKEPLGGTWMGVSVKGSLRLGILTNVHDDAPQPMSEVRSRGELLREWLASSASAEEYINGIRLEHYEGFNLVLFEVTHEARSWHVTNRGQSAPMPACGGVSNSEMQKPFIKVTEGQRAFEEAIDGAKADEEVVNALMDVMSSTHPVSAFRDLASTISVPLIDMSLREPHTLASSSAHNSSPIKFPHEHQVHPYPTAARAASSHVCARGVHTKPASLALKLDGVEPYATRLTTVVLVRKDGACTFVERDRWWLDEKGEARCGGTEDRKFEWRVDLEQKGKVV